MANTEEKVKPLNPRLVMKQWMHHLPAKLPGALTQIIQGLWCFSNDFFTEEELIDEDSSFQTTRTGLRQLADFTHFSISSIQRKLARLRQLGLVYYPDHETHPLGTLYMVFTKPHPEVLTRYSGTRVPESKKKSLTAASQPGHSARTEPAKSSHSNVSPSERSSNVVSVAHTPNKPNVSPLVAGDLGGLRGTAAQVDGYLSSSGTSTVGSGTFSRAQVGGVTSGFGSGFPGDKTLADSSSVNRRSSNLLQDQNQQQNQQPLFSPELPMAPVRPAAQPHDQNLPPAAPSQEHRWKTISTGDHCVACYEARDSDLGRQPCVPLPVFTPEPKPQSAASRAPYGETPDIDLHF
jgi:hypothetical protein